MYWSILTGCILAVFLYILYEIYIAIIRANNILNSINYHLSFIEPIKSDLARIRRYLDENVDSDHPAYLLKRDLEYR